MARTDPAVDKAEGNRSIRRTQKPGLHTKGPEIRGVPAPEGRIRGGRGIALRHEGSLVAEGRMAVRGRQHGEQSGFTMSVGTCLV